jgi:hypothetical protein
MQPISQDILIRFDDILKQRNVPLSCRSDYRKWLRYFLDFRSKYPLPDSKADQVRLFAEKLRSKNQTTDHQEQAADAVSLFFALQQMKKTIVSSSEAPPYDTEWVHEHNKPVHAFASRNEHDMICEPPDSSAPPAPPRRGGKQYDEWRCLRKTESPEWDKVIVKLADEIKIRHYSH